MNTKGRMFLYDGLFKSNIQTITITNFDNVKFIMFAVILTMFGHLTLKINALSGSILKKH